MYVTKLYKIYVQKHYTKYSMQNLSGHNNIILCIYY